jgi:hypothetical protein
MEDREMVVPVEGHDQGKEGSSTERVVTVVPRPISPGRRRPPNGTSIGST